LYARLSPAEQQRIFQSHPGRRVVLATNVAETSLTVPGIRYVIDTGTARISRYSYRAKVQRLPIEAISQASANQRKGRCGRVEPGLCVRLYSEEDFLSRPEFTDPEILRTNLAAVILQMLHLRLGQITDFPFIEPPDGKAISDGFNLLQELSAVNRENQLTPLGRQLARLPVDPRMGRMLLEAARQGSLQEVLIVASAMSIQDPRERPPERQQAADQAHAQWKDQDSDFAGLVNLWRGFEEQRQALTASPLRNWCRRNFLNYLRLREWRDSHRQLSLICRDLQLTVNKEPADYPKFHKAVLSGLLSQIGQKTEEGDYLGARQRRFWVHPSSGLGRKRPQWIMAAELVETTKLYARMVAKIEPDWIEPLAGHLVKKNHFEPHWEKKRGQVVAFEQITLFGLIVVGRRPVHFGPIDPAVSREFFIREGLVRGEIQSRAKCLSANARLLEALDELEAKARRRDILADEETLFRFYDERLPAEIHQTATFDAWYRMESQKNPQLLIMREEDVLAREASEVTANQYPDTLRLGELTLPLTYHFEPNHPRDGVTLRVPAPLLLSLPAERLEWLVPGLLETKCVALVRNLPKALRKNFVPVPDFVKAALQRMVFAEGSLPQALGRELLRMTGARVTDEAWAEAAQQVENHLKMNLEVVDANGKFLGEGRDLDELTARFAEAGQAALAVPQTGKSQQPVEAKGFAAVAEKTQQKIAGLSMTVYPALVEEGGAVKEGRFSTQTEAEYQHRRALQRLLLQQLAEPAKFLRSKLPGQTELALLYRDMGRVDALIEDILLASLDTSILEGEASLPRDGAGLLSLAERKRGSLTEHAERLARLTLEILKLWHGLQKRFKGKIDLAQAVALNDIKGQLGKLVYPGFVRETPSQWLKELPRYLKAIELRLEKLGSQVQKDRVWSIELGNLWAQYQTRADKHAQEGKRDDELVVYRWWLEEYRVSLFAQQLGTKVPISDKRLSKQWSQVEG
jgi:ATP-dependent helicase HrpA